MRGTKRHRRIDKDKDKNTRTHTEAKTLSKKKILCTCGGGYSLVLKLVLCFTFVKYATKSAVLLGPYVANRQYYWGRMSPIGSIIGAVCRQYVVKGTPHKHVLHITVQTNITTHVLRLFINENTFTLSSSTAGPRQRWR